MIDYNKYALSPTESRKWGLIALICATAFYILLFMNGLGGTRAFFAGASIGALIGLGRLRKDLLSTIWFWATIFSFFIVHSIVFLLLPNEDFHYPGALALPFLFADILVMFHAVLLIERLLNKTREG